MSKDVDGGFQRFQSIQVNTAGNRVSFTIQTACIFLEIDQSIEIVLTFNQVKNLQTNEEIHEKLFVWDAETKYVYFSIDSFGKLCFHLNIYDLVVPSDSFLFTQASLINSTMSRFDRH